MSFISPSSACIIECKLTLLFESFGSELEVTTAFRSVVYVRALVTRDTCKGNSSCRSFPIKKSTPCGKFSTRPHKIVPDNLSDSILTSTSGTSVGCPKISWISLYSSVSTKSPAARHFLTRAAVKPPNLVVRLPAVVNPYLCTRSHLHKMELIFVDQTLIFSAQLQIWVFCYQSKCFRRRFKCSVLHLGLWVHKRFLCITYRRCMTASATPYAKDFWSPITGYRDRCFVIVIPLMMIFLEFYTAAILLKGFFGFIRIISIDGFPRIILFGVKWLVENGVLVR